MAVSATISHVLSATTPDDPLYEIQPQHWNSGHNVTLSQDIVATEISGLFSNANGVSFGTSGGGGSTKITGSHNALTSQSNQAVSAANGSYAFQTLSFSNANGVSFGTSAGSAVTASHNALTSQSNQNVTAGNGGFAFQTLSFSNANGFSFGTSAGSAITGSYTVPTQSNQTLGGYAVGNTTGESSSSTFDARTLSLRASDNISIGYSNGSVVFKAAAGGGGDFSAGVSNVGNTAGDTGITGTRVVFAGGNNVTVSQGTDANGATVTISAANAPAQTAQTQSNIQGIGASDTTYNTGTVIFSAQANVTLGTSVDGASQYVRVSVAAPGAGNEVTMSQYPWFMSTQNHSINSGTTGGTGASTQITAQFSVHPFMLHDALTFDNVVVPISCATVAGTASATVGYFFGIYTLTGSTLSLLSSAQYNAVISQNSVTARTCRWWWGTNSAANSSSLQGNISASMTGNKWALMSTGGNSLPKGQYWFAAGHTARTTGANINSSNSWAGRGEYISNAVAGVWGALLNSQLWQLIGTVSTTTNTNSTGFAPVPGSINTTLIQPMAGGNPGQLAKQFVMRMSQTT